MRGDDDESEEDCLGLGKSSNCMGTRHHFKKGGDTYNFYGNVTFNTAGDCVGRIGKITELSKEEESDDESIEAVKDHEERFHKEDEKSKSNNLIQISCEQRGDIVKVQRLPDGYNSPVIATSS